MSNGEVTDQEMRRRGMSLRREIEERFNVIIPESEPEHPADTAPVVVDILENLHLGMECDTCGTEVKVHEIKLAQNGQSVMLDMRCPRCKQGWLFDWNKERVGRAIRFVRYYP